MKYKLYENFSNWVQKGSVFIISDFHFNDKDAVLMNPNWLSADEYVKKINSLVYKDDTLICLGDCGDISFISKLRAGYKVLIKGNHDDKGDSTYKKQEIWEKYKKDEYTRKELLCVMREKYPNAVIDIRDGNNFFMLAPEYWIVYINTNLFDEVYNGPIFISDKLLLSHEPVNGLSFCCNIHGHIHNGKYEYVDDFGCKHLNVASDVINWTPLKLDDLIKSGAVSNITDIHRLVINKAICNPIHKN